MSRRNSMSFRLLAFAVLGTLILVGCGGNVEEPRISVPVSAKDGDLEMISQDYEISDTVITAEYGILTVPENRDDPDSRLIALPIVRMLSLSETPLEPIFYFNGGPGISNMRMSRFEGLLENHEIILMGYRGVDGSEYLDCPEVGLAFGNAPYDLLDKRSIEVVRRAYGDCAERLHQEGIDTDGYTISEVLADIDVTRLALGYDKISTLSGSYGTRLALLYGWLHPENVHRSAMVGPNPPGKFLWDPKIIDEQLELYSDLCAADPTCSARTDDLAQTMRDLSQDMPTSWFGFPIKRGHIFMGTFMMLYHTESAVGILNAWLDAAEGDYAAFAAMTVMLNRMFPNASVWGESISKVFSTDYFIDSPDEFYDEMTSSKYIIGSPAALLGLGGVGSWPRKEAPLELREVRPSNVETLFVTGDLDFSTPPQNTATYLMPVMPNATQVVLKNFGHTGDLFWLQPGPRSHLLANFFESGAVDMSKFVDNTITFEAGMGFGDYAKIGLLVVTAIIIGLIFFIRYMMVRRKSA